MEWSILCLMKLTGESKSKTNRRFRSALNKKHLICFIFNYYRLFEMGFGEQVSEIVRRLPNTRQTVLFSATLPKLLVEFTKAGLHDPTLIRYALLTLSMTSVLSMCLLHVFFTSFDNQFDIGWMWILSFQKR